ncbi:MAG: Abi family protein [Clostridium sp.]|nr:Abi family protein [Clostridium sp.]
MSYKTIDGLMRHLRSNHIEIWGSAQKRQLRNTGYFHGYKGFRFFRDAQNKIPFVSYDEIYATIQYDSALKSLFYGKIMFIETAVKNIALESILDNAKSESIQNMYDRVVEGYNNAPLNCPIEKRKEMQEHKLILQNKVQSNLARAYKNNNAKIVHYYNSINNSSVPIWALFEIMTMGDFGYLLCCLTYDVRDDISRRLGINISCDTSRQLIYKYIYALKDLRNAIAHNAVIFDTRFRESSVSKPMKQCLQFEIGLPYVNFKTIGDYVILMCYYLKLLDVPKTDIKAFIREFEKITKHYRTSVSTYVSSIVIHPDLDSRMELLKKFI